MDRLKMLEELRLLRAHAEASTCHDAPGLIQKLLDLMIAEREEARTVVGEVVEAAPPCMCGHAHSLHRGVGAYDTPPCRYPNCSCTHYMVSPFV